MWVESIEIAKAEKVEAGTLTFLELANDCRKSAKRLPTGRAKVVKGSFGPTFAEPSAVGEDAPGKSSDDENGQKTGKKKKNKRRKRTDAATATACRGCGTLGHYYLTCFYLLPHLAPKGFKPREELVKAAEIALKEDTVLAEEIKRLKIAKPAKAKKAV